MTVAQTILSPDNDYAALDAWLDAVAPRALFLVCDPSLRFLTRFNAKLDAIARRLPVVRFSDFQPNPLYESVVAGVEAFRASGADAILAVGGGSAIDVAKCVKLYATLDSSKNYLQQDIVPNSIPLLAMPTTAGTGSEATRFAVVYYEGAKQSIAHESAIPSAVLLDSSCLETLPPYQKKATAMDALCHAVESCWSVHSTAESQAFSRDAIRLVLAHLPAYLSGDAAANAPMLRAAPLAGHALDITQTTAGHALCYKLTSLFGVAHGHAAILCDRVLFPWMLDKLDRCADPRGPGHLAAAFQIIAEAMDCPSPAAAAAKLSALFDSLDLSVPSATPAQFDELCANVNPVRLKNHPITLAAGDIADLYRLILAPTPS